MSKLKAIRAQAREVDGLVTEDIRIRLSKRHLRLLDDLCKELNVSRSELMRSALLKVGVDLGYVSRPTNSDFRNN